MSLKYKFDKFNEDNPEKRNEQSEEAVNNIERYETPSNTRNLVFVYPDGKQFSRNYSYLMSVEFSPEDELIKLVYTTDAITIKGHNLKNIFDDLTAQNIKRISCIDKRYAGTQDNDICFVTELIIQNIP